MFTSPSFFLLLLLPFCLLLLPSSIAIPLHNHLLSSHSSPTPAAATSHSATKIPPSVFFEVTKPIHLPTTKPCVHHVLHHDFASTYAHPPVLANYTPPPHCSSRHFSTIVLEWNATCKGRQFDRIFGVWLDGVELLRSCTAEPTPSGIRWTVRKDITRYRSLLLSDRTRELAVYIGNVVTSTYTGIYHVDISLYFYPDEDHHPTTSNAFTSNIPADLILPISRNLPLSDGLWFEIQNSTQVVSKDFKVPPNAYRAVMEVYVSPHENDEFWYSNFLNDYITANNLTGYPGNGPFREVVVSLDGDIVGAIWPFTVIYTGGVNPLFWRPITAIGSFDLPSYDIEITPFLGTLLDGKTHQIGFAVTNALNVWYIDANLHLWLDHHSVRTQGKLLKHDGKPLALSLVSNFHDLNGTFLTSGRRSIASTGWVRSSHGKITTHFNQHLSYKNSMELAKDGNLQIVNQTIRIDDNVSFRKKSRDFHSSGSMKTFRIDMFSDSVDLGNETSSFVANMTLGFNEKNSEQASSLENLQKTGGYMIVKGNLVQSGFGATQQVYNYHDGSSCYSRNVSSSNYTILYDKERDTCHQM